MTALIPDPEHADRWLIGNAAVGAFGQQVNNVLLTNVHPADRCAGEWCCVHNPSPHHMRGWPLNWRNDRRLMERICSHGVGHPDPDDTNPDDRHGCCAERCCQA